MKSKKIPQTDSIQELARFWDTHDLTDFENELEEVTEPIFQREALIRIRLPQNEFETIKKIAKSRGVEYTVLIRQWVSEKAEASWFLNKFFIKYYEEGLFKRVRLKPRSKANKIL